jgi:hypothetical protein
MSLRFRSLCLFFIVTLSVLLGGCASRLSYQVIDIWLAWSADDYVSLTSRQETLLDQRVDALVEWHRTTQLPRYIDWLRTFRERVKQPMSGEDFAAEFNYLNGFVDDVIKRVEPDILDLVATLSDQQLEELKKNLLRQNDETLAEYRDMMPAKRQRQREDSASSNVQRWIGKLNRQERVLVRNWSRDLAGTGEERYKTSILWQESFFAAAALRQDRAAFQAAMKPLLYAPENYRSEQYTKILLDNQRKTFNMLGSIHQSLEKNQKKRLDLSIDSWIDTLESLTDTN